MHDCHVVTYSVSDLSVTSFIGFRSDCNSAYPLYLYAAYAYFFSRIAVLSAYERFKGVYSTPP